MDTDAKIAALKEATREANEVLGDIKRTLREAREFAEVEVPKMVKATVEPIVEENLASWKVALDESIEKSTQAVYARFDVIADLLLGEDRKSKKLGMPTVQQMVEKRIEDGSTPS